MSDPLYVFNERLLASDRTRFVGCIFDFLAVFISVFVSGIIVVTIGNVFNWNIFSIWENLIENYTYSSLLGFLLFNYFILEWSFGRTMGKLITGTIVVNKNGLRPGFSAIFIRTLCRLIPFDMLSFLSKSGRIWHDSISKTYVVNKIALKKEMELFYGLNLIGVEETT